MQRYLHPAQRKLAGFLSSLLLLRAREFLPVCLDRGPDLRAQSQVSEDRIILFEMLDTVMILSQLLAR